MPTATERKMEYDLLRQSVAHMRSTVRFEEAHKSGYWDVPGLQMQIATLDEKIRAMEAGVVDECRVCGASELIGCSCVMPGHEWGEIADPPTCSACGHKTIPEAVCDVCGRCAGCGSKFSPIVDVCP